MYTICVCNCEAEDTVGIPEKNQNNKGMYKTEKNPLVFCIDRGITIEEVADVEESYGLLNFPYDCRYMSHSDGSLSFNEVNRNRMFQVSHAQRERMKHYKSSIISCKRDNYELVKLLESIAASHYTSVPMVVKSWKAKRHHVWYYFDDDYNSVHLSDAELDSLDELLL